MTTFPQSRALVVLLLLLVLLLQSPRTLAQTPFSAPTIPVKHSPPLANVTDILDKAGVFSTLIRLLKLTGTADQITTQLNYSNQGLTLFAPNDNAFTILPIGTLNSLTNQEKVSIMHFHILPTFFSLMQFQTVSNPLQTQAGDNSPRAFPMNVTASGNRINISTGVDSAMVSSIIYTDNKLGVYQVDRVLLPMSIFGASTNASGSGSSSGSTSASTSALAPVAGKEKEKPAEVAVGGGPVAVNNAPVDASDGGRRDGLVWGVGFMAMVAMVW